MGLIPGAKIRLVKRAPMGDPLAIEINGYNLTLRGDEAGMIVIEPAEDNQASEQSRDDRDFSYNLSLHEHNAHPGLGEEGKYHSHEDENPLPEGTDINFALIGQLNSGKTTLYNQLTGANSHVGNFPGVTTDINEGRLKGRENATVTDLPGIYSLSTYTEEERIARKYILEQKPEAIINIVDVSNIERNLYLTMQLMELDIPMVLALNMMDELKANGGGVRLNEMERELGIPVVPIAASKGEGLDELVEHALHTAKYQEAPQRQDFCDPEEAGGAVHRCLHGIMTLVEDHARRAGISARFAAGRLVEGDAEVLGMLKLDRNEEDALEHIISQMEQERGLDRHAAMADMRYSFIRKLCNRTVKRPVESREFIRSRSIDSVLTGKWTAIPAFFAIIALIFWLAFDVIGLRLQNLLSGAIGALGEAVGRAFISWNVGEGLRSLVIDAIFGGVGYVISFIPIIVVLFFFLSLLEDSGYMARIAFVSDKILRKAGLSGRSIVPLLIGFGCSVPGIMAATTLPSSTDRRRTILLIPFMSCSGRIAVYGFLSAAFFPGKAGLVMTSLYLLGIIVGIAVALFGKFVRREKGTAPFVMEMPVYRLPIARNVGHLLWDKTRDFIQNAFTIIFLATIVIWLLQHFSWGFSFVSEEESILASIAGWIAPIMQPLGLGDWKIVTSLVSGLLAKENIVATMEVLNALESLTAATAVPMLVFSLLYTPCVASIAAMRREFGWKWSAFAVIYQCAIAWLCAWVAYMIVLI